MSRTLVMSTTFPQFAGDPRGHFVVEHWRQRSSIRDDVRFLAPHSRWTRGQLTGLDVRRVHYAPPRRASLTGQHGTRALHVPLHLGYSARGYPLVGTSLAVSEQFEND